MLPNLSMQELIIFGGIAIMLFGKRLPEVAKSLGSTYRQFREGLADFQRQMDMTSAATTTPSKWSQPKTTQRDAQAPTAPKFEPPALPVPSSTAAESTAAAGDESGRASDAAASSAPSLAAGEPSGTHEATA